MCDNREKQIKMRAHELCRENSANIHNIPSRNEKIVFELMKEFNITREYAEYCFINNNIN